MTSDISANGTGMPGGLDDHIYNRLLRERIIFLGSDVRDENAIDQGDPGLKVDSVTGVWPGAEWMEREVYDMLGILFVGHPDLRRILTWNGFGSYPLRKDYPLRGIGERERYKIVTREGA